MAGLRPAFLAHWWQTVPTRLRCLVVPYGKALGLYVASYAGATALLRPWALGGWWSLGVPLLAGLGACWWLWQPWALLARNYKGESRRLPLYFTLLLLLCLSYCLRQVLYARLGEMHDLHNVHELTQPGVAIFFRLHGPFFIDKSNRGGHATTDFIQSKNGTKTYYADCFYACPLLATAADTTVATLPVPAWLAYTYREELGTNLSPGELNWRYTNFVARSDAQFDTLTLTHFTYLKRAETSAIGAFRAVRASRLAPRTAGEPLLLTPVQAPFALRGLHVLTLTLITALAGSAVIIFLLLVMQLRPVSEWPGLTP